jgi:hypothetical protein
MNAEVRQTQPDTELARMAAEGDAAAFEEIHRRYRRLVYNVALRMTGNAPTPKTLRRSLSSRACGASAAFEARRRSRRGYIASRSIK